MNKAREKPSAQGFETIDDRLDAIIAMSNDVLIRDADKLSRELVQAGETTLESWVRSKGGEPTDKAHEGFRLLALHRQGARGDPSFNACRETCRELIYLYNCIQMAEYDKDKPKNLKLAAMVVRHLVLFIDGKLENSGLGEFCCSSKPLRLNEAAGTA